MKKMKMRMNEKIALFLAVFFFSFNTIYIYNVSADAASLTVTGGSLGTSGLNDLGALFPYSAPIILGILHQADMDIKLSEQSQAAGMTKTQYLYDQILNWKDGATEAVSQVCERILTGTSIDSEGLIYLGQTALDAVKQLGNWIVTNNGENFSNTDTSVSDFDTVTIGNFSTYYGTSLTCQNGNYLLSWTSSAPVAWLKASYSRYTYFILLSTTDFSVSESSIMHKVPSDRGKIGNYYVKSMSTNGYINNSNPTLTNIGTFATSEAIFEYIGTLEGFNIDQGEVPENYFEGSVNAWQSFIPSLDLPVGYTGAIDFGILNQILAELEESKNYEMTVEDYLEAINEAVNDQAVDVPVENVDDGSIAYVPDVVIVPDPAYDPVADPDIPVPEEVTPVIDDSKPANFEDLMNQPLTLDLKNFFPFCIPFDLYNLFQKFNAPAVAPNFRINFTIPIVNQEVDYTIDFSPFNDVAAVLRTMELIAMVVLLALATRRIFLRG